MTDIIFARTRWEYKSYSDFWRLVTLSGFPVCYVDEIDAADASKCYIFTPRNGETPGWPDAKATIIHWNIEQDCYPPIPGVSETWCSDATLARLCNAKYVMMGSHPGLLLTSPQVSVEQAYDFIALAYWTHRRAVIRDELTRRGFTFGSDTWGDFRHTELLASAYMLHIHQNDGKPYIAPQRWCIAAAYHLPLVSETVGHRGAFPAETFLELTYNDLRLRVNPGDLNGYGMGAALHHWLCVDNTFRRQVERHV
jgi:hypothetical protein